MENLLKQTHQERVKKGVRVQDNEYPNLFIVAFYDHEMDSYFDIEGEKIGYPDIYDEYSDGSDNDGRFY